MAALDTLNTAIVRLSTSIDNLASKPPVVGVPEAAVQASAENLNREIDRLDTLVAS
jgi:hypothetical protein